MWWVGSVVNLFLSVKLLHKAYLKKYLFLVERLGEKIFAESDWYLFFNFCKFFFKPFSCITEMPFFLIFQEFLIFTNLNFLWKTCSFNPKLERSNKLLLFE